MLAEQITDPVAYHAEGPVWSETWGGLRWVDMFAGDVLSLGEDGSIARRNVGRIAAAIRPRTDGGAVIGVERGFALEAADGAVSHLPSLWNDPSLRMNEGGCDPDGRFYCGSMSYERVEGAGSLYRLDASLQAIAVLTAVTISNGIEWSPDANVAYYNDTETLRIDRFDYSSESGLSNRRMFAAIEGGDGRPDGLTVDSEGGVWVALNKGGVVRRYTPSGQVDEVVELPVTGVTACTFGGTDLSRLFITTSREGLDDSAQPAAGSLFYADVGVRGLPVRLFAG